MNRMYDISVIIPVYCSSQSLEELCARLLTSLDRYRFEIIMVDDSSADNSWIVIQALAKRFPNIIGLRLSKNFGQHCAILAGIRVAKGKKIVTMDDDLQHPPEEIEKLILAMDASKSDVIYGTPLQISHSFFRRLASIITKATLKGAMGVKSARNVSAFRIFSSELCKCFANYKGSAVNIDVMLTWGTNKFSSTQVVHEKRKYGKTKYTPGKLIKHAVNMITGFSTLPLQVASILGICIAIFGGFILIYVIYNYLVNGSTVPGFVFTVCIISFFSGAQLLALGIIGEYLSRVYEKTSDKPAFLVAESIGTEI